MTTDANENSEHGQPLGLASTDVLGALVRSAALLACVATTAACSEQTRGPAPDQCIRAELFKSCLAALPAGPQATKYNDWDEVVSACESAAYFQSLRKRETIKAECKL